MQSVNVFVQSFRFGYNILFGLRMYVHVFSYSMQLQSKWIVHTAVQIKVCTLFCFEKIMLNWNERRMKSDRFRLDDIWMSKRTNIVVFLNSIQKSIFFCFVKFKKKKKDSNTYICSSQVKATTRMLQIGNQQVFSIHMCLALCTFLTNNNSQNLTETKRKRLSCRLKMVLKASHPVKWFKSAMAKL